MNELQRAMSEAPSIETVVCPFCGRPPQNRHHIIPRSAGGTNCATITVCGMGNASGCHGLLHAHKLHLRWRGGQWEWLRTKQPTKYEKTLEMEGWRKLDYERYSI